MERYRTIVDDYEGFVASLSAPLGRVVWANPLRAGFDVERFAAYGIKAEPISWTRQVWRVPPGTSIGSLPEHRLGQIHVQEEVTLWPADLVGARPGENVLDMCAAPGNKTARMASNMDNTGYILANEKRWQRVSSLRFNLERLGVTCAAVSVGDGRELNFGEGEFDRALVDAPCSGEGMIRKARGFARETSENERAGLVGTQKGLMRKASESVRSGGTIVYATCTFAPEENEGVVLWALQNLPVDLEYLPVQDGLNPASGVLQWGGENYEKIAPRVGRFWPHQHNTGGFFVAKFRRL